MSEHDLQRAVCAYLKASLPPYVVWSAVDHGAGKMSPAAAGQRKARGVKKGQADLRFILPPHGQCGEIELKAKRGYLSPEQRQWGEHVVAAGGLYAVCRSLDEVDSTLRGWGVQLRGRLAA